MTQSYLAQGLKQSRFLFELHTRESGKQSCCGNFRTFSLITRIHSSEASKWVFTRHGPLHLWNLFGITRFLRALSPCSTTISRRSDYLPSTSHCWQTLETEEIDGNCSKFGPILQIHEVNNSRLYRFFDADGKSCLRSQRSKSN